MAGEPELHYFSGCGRMESIGWLLAAAGVEVCSKDRSLMSQQVPMVDIDGMTLVQTRTILNYMAPKYNLCGRDLKERALCGDVLGEDLRNANKALKTRISNLPTVKKFLQPGSPRKPPIDEKSLEQAKKIFRIK
nr:glutathione S-transferase A3-like [Mirounga angustirostris]